MKKLKTPVQLIIILMLIACQSSKKDPDIPEMDKKFTHSEFGKLQGLDKNKSVTLDLSHHNNWSELVNQVEKISCNDSLVNISLASEKEIKTIYFSNSCLEESIKITKQKNVIEIHNNKIRKNIKDVFPLDSLTYVIKRDINNKGLNPDLCESQDKIIFSVYYDDKFEDDKLIEILKKLSDTYFNITDKKDLDIWLTSKRHFRLPEKHQSNI